MTQLHELPEADGIDDQDMILVRDVSDTTDGASGTDKFVRKQNLGIAAVGNEQNPTYITGDVDGTLALFRSRMAQSIDGGGVCNIALQGDSLTEGYYVDSLNDRWTERLRRALKAHTGTTSTWFRPARSGLGRGNANWPGGVDPWTFTGTVTDTMHGPALLSVDLGPGASMTTTFVGRLPQVAFRKKSNSAATALRMLVDGFQVATINTNAATASDDLYAPSQQLGEGEHTLTLEYTGSTGTATINGLFVYDDTISGVGFSSVFNFGHGGIHAANLASDSPTTWESVYYAVQASVVVIELGVNDMSNGRTTAQFTADYREIVQRIRTATNPETGFILMAWKPNEGWSTTQRDMWLNEWVPAIKTIAEEELPGRSMVVELEVPIADDLALFPDGVHPTGTSGGHAWIADLMLRLLGIPYPVTATGSSGGTTTGSSELAFASSTTGISGVSNVATDLPGLSITFEVTDTPVMVELYNPWVATSAADGIAGLIIADTANTMIRVATVAPGTGLNGISEGLVYERITAPGIYTRKAQIVRSSGTGTVGSLVNLASVEAHIRAYKV